MNELRTFTFSRGAHISREDGLCVMEAVALLAGESHSDHPSCADPVITWLAIWLNDSCGDELRQELLLDLPWRIVGTKSTPEIEQRRAYMAADWSVRTVCPIILRRSGRVEGAAKLESLPVVDSPESARAAADAAARAAYAAARAADVAYAAAYVANAAAYAAARAADVAYAAAYVANAAADVAARAADVAADAAARAAYVAADVASDLEQIQRSCAGLLDRMIRLTEPQEVKISQQPRKVVVV